MNPVHVYEVRPRKDKRGVDLISDALPFGRLSYNEVAEAIANAIGHAKFCRRSPRRLICHAQEKTRATTKPITRINTTSRTTQLEDLEERKNLARDLHE